MKESVMKEMPVLLISTRDFLLSLNIQIMILSWFGKVFYTESLINTEQNFCEYTY